MLTITLDYKAKYINFLIFVQHRIESKAQFVLLLGQDAIDDRHKELSLQSGM